MAESKSAREERKQRIMKNLNCTAEEAEEMMAEDDIIDHGGRTDFDLSPEEEKRRKKMANVNEHKTAKKTERKRKENPTKQGIISEIATFLNENCGIECEKVEIVNKEREITFVSGDFNYSVTLIQHRKPKN